MGRKRKSVPVRLDETKRQLVTWNMNDLTADVHIVSENDPQYLRELEDVQHHKQESESNVRSQIHPGSGLSQAALETLQEDLINECDFYLTVKRQLPLEESPNWQCILGTFEVYIQSLTVENHATSSTVALPIPDSPELWLYVSPTQGKHCLYFELDNKSAVCFTASCSMPYKCLEGLQWRAFKLGMKSYSATAAKMEIRIHINELALTKLLFSSEGFRTMRGKKINSSLQALMGYLHGYTLPDYQECLFNKKHDIKELYEEIKRRHKERSLDRQVDVQHGSLRPRLRQYQKDAIYWMLTREHKIGCYSGPGPESLHCLFEEFTSPDGHLLYYNRHGGILVKDKPLCTQSPPGGILADEMGLGKTVEVLALMLAHPRSDVPQVDPLPVVSPDEEDEESKPMDVEGNSSCKSTPEISSVATISTEITVKSSSTPMTASTDSSGQVVRLSESKETEPCSISSELATLDHLYCQTANSLPLTDLRTEDNIIMSLQTKCSEQLPVPPTGRKGKSKSNALKGKGALPVLNRSDQTVGSVLNGSGNDAPSLTPEGATQSPLGGATDIVNPSQKTEQLTTKTQSENVVEEATFFTEVTVKPKSYLECICGQTDQGSVSEEENDRLRVQCNTCGLWQHPECVHYDLTDPYRGVYQCPHCHVLSPPIPSGATLIISPNSISHQWVEEINKHIHEEKLKVLVYTGVHKHGFLQPQQLARYDIVITTYETLQKEINYVDLPHSNSEAGRRFRRPKRFMAIPSPLIAVEWWRICLDEAQMVECTTTKTAEMALRLTAVNRWCVTGTPIQKGIEDLYGLLLFLGLDPYWVHTWWTNLLYQPFCYGDKERLHQVISAVLWRTCKNDVLDEICLPMQSEQVHWLNFSPVEEHFYNRQFSLCARDALGKLSKFSDGLLKLESLDRYTLHDLLAPLSRLRQACCHPQAVRGSFLPICKSTMTMEELLTSLIKKAVQECEEAHRQLVAATNGLAGLLIVKEQYLEAVEHYREVLRSVTEQGDQFRTDPLQQLHTLHNLNEILVLKPCRVDPTLRDGKLGEEATELKRQYLLKAATFVNQAEEMWSQIRLNLTQLQRELKGGEDWWAELLQWIVYIGVSEMLVERVKDDLADNSRLATQSLAYRFRDAIGLEYVLASQMEDLDTAHQSLIDALGRLQGQPSLELINQTVECCLRPASQILKTCPFCKTEKLFGEYESKLFSFSEKGVSEVDGADGVSLLQVSTSRQGTWADSEAERALKTLISFAKGYGADRDLLQHGNTHIKVLEALKKEFKCIRTLWIELRAQVSTYDELDMATTRLRLRLVDEPVADPPQPNIINPEEYDTQKLKLKSDKIIGETQLRRKKSQLFYLKNLAKSQSNLDGGENPDLCPVCQHKLGTKWSVLTCGHCFCLDCVRILVDQYSFGGHHQRLRCPMCRQMTSHKDISYVTTETKQTKEDIPIKGDHSTKVEGVIRCVMKIIRAEPGSKILVFSVWQNVLGILSDGLRDNSIPFCSHSAQKNLQSILWNFKNRDDIPVLLIPVHSGSNGLNLIEANHVILVEPILNPGQELQAIGRVHRIGQTRATFVHRFLVRGTIEERLHHLLATAVTKSVTSNDTDDTPFTIEDLRDLFRDNQPEFHEESDQDHEEVTQNGNIQGLAGVNRLIHGIDGATETEINLNHGVEREGATETRLTHGVDREGPTETRLTHGVDREGATETETNLTHGVDREGATETQLTHDLNREGATDAETRQTNGLNREGATEAETHQTNGLNREGATEAEPDLTHGLNREGATEAETHQTNGLNR